MTLYSFNTSVSQCRSSTPFVLNVAMKEYMVSLSELPGGDQRTKSALLPMARSQMVLSTRLLV
jgi:hypothetical protein